MALEHVKHVEAVAIMRAVSEQPAFRALPKELQQTVEGWLEENHPTPTAYSAAMRSMVDPRCPVCDGVNVEAQAQQVARYRAEMAPMTVEAGQVAYLCENGHYHDGKRETGPVPEDITIREGL